MADRVMNRVTCPEVSAFYQSEHARHGVRIVCNARVHALRRACKFEARARRRVRRRQRASRGRRHRRRGRASRRTSSRKAAGLECTIGIVVDEFCRTSDPNIYAAGDCTSHHNFHYDRRMRLESVDNAFEQGASAALNMLGTPTPHDKLPWFWSDQYDLKLIIVGISIGLRSAW